MQDAQCTMHDFHQALTYVRATDTARLKSLDLVFERVYSCVRT